MFVSQCGHMPTDCSPFELKVGINFELHFGQLIVLDLNIVGLISLNS